MTVSAVGVDAPPPGAMPTDGSRDPDHDRLRRRVLLILSGAIVLMLSHAFVPTEEFVHRGDDAFYYFQVAVNYGDVGFWTFDSINSTNGVQPLWAIVLTVVATPLRWLGVDDPDVLARVFVGLTALAHFASSMVLFHVLSRKVSIATAVAAAGAFLFPLGLVWARVWGMENSLYALTLLSSVALFHLWFLPRPTVGRAVVLGIVLGLTALSRLNAGLFVACLLAYYVFRGDHVGLLQRLRLGVVAGIAAIGLVAPYLTWNLVSTDHLLPISGTVKKVKSDRWLTERGVESRLSPAFVSEVYQTGRRPLSDFVEARVTDGLWLVGGRLAFPEAPRLPAVAGLLALVSLLPALIGDRKEWLRRLRERFSRLRVFAYVGVFAVLDAALAVFLFPDEMRYAIVRWWLVAAEIVIVVVAATVAGEGVAHLVNRFVPKRRHLVLATAGLTTLLVLHGAQTLAFFWDGKVQHTAWHRSWNDESFLAARWLEQNASEEALVGSWNAGVLGFYATQRVVNLDGLINGFNLLPYLEARRIGDYVERERIEYLSDLEPMFSMKHPELTNLTLTEVYRHHSAFARRDYVIYRVDPRPAGSEAGTGRSALE